MRDIGELYAIEREADEGKVDALTRLEARRARGRPILARIYGRTLAWKMAFSLKGKMGKAIKYLRNSREALKCFLLDGRVPIDNNACENAIRPVAIGSKNFLFAGSERGGEAAALVYSVIESCRRAEVDRWEYLSDVLVRVATRAGPQFARRKRKTRQSESARRGLLRGVGTASDAYLNPTNREFGDRLGWGGAHSRALGERVPSLTSAIDDNDPGLVPAPESMNTRARFLAVSLVLSLSMPALAQVPAGHGLRFSFGNNSPAMEYIDLSGGSPPIHVQGITGTHEISAGAIDPLNHRVWLCETNFGLPTVGKLLRLTLSGNTAQNQTVMVNFGLGSVLSAIAFDRDADVFLAGRDSSGFDTVWRVDRVTNQFAAWDSVVSAGSFNAMTIDPVTNRMWVGTFNSSSNWKLLEYDLDAGPGPGTVVLDVPIASFDGAFGMSFDGNRTLYISTLSVRVLSFDLVTHVASPLAGAPTHGINGLAFDSTTGLLHSVGNNGDSSWDAIDLSSGSSTEIDAGIDPSCTLSCPAASGLAIPGPQDNPIVKYCSGDGIDGVPCPCGNEGVLGAGCKNSTGVGAGLSNGGSSSSMADDFQPRAQRLVPGKPALLFSGTAQVNNGNGVPFGDGLRCVGGAITRLQVRISNGNGAASWGPGLITANGWAVGSTVYLQTWYRDPQGSPCGLGFNLTNGLSVLIEP